MVINKGSLGVGASGKYTFYVVADNGDCTVESQKF